MSIFEGILSFNGSWRSYQQRVLEHSRYYFDDNKYHIVAAPGSGKTVLGIELLRRLGGPCLILSPTITIRQQWLTRVREHFLQPGAEPSLWLSNSIKSPRPITSITYQSLYMGMKHYAGRILEADGTEEVDFSGFDVFTSLREAGLTTLCLDEAHHLRSDWWRALEQLVRQFPNLRIISLTATPPYDAPTVGWQRYIDLCGPIDEEIYTPELVREGSLCPHQDYLFFSLPAKEEEAAIAFFNTRANQCVSQLLADPAFLALVMSHKGLQNPESDIENYLAKPDYLQALLIFAGATLLPLSTFYDTSFWLWVRDKLPKLDMAKFEMILQGILFDDVEAFACTEEYRKELRGYLRAYGCIGQNRVRLTGDDKFKNMLAASKGKLHSIVTIVQQEHRSLKDKLRGLILCDHIKKDALRHIGTDEDVFEMGAVPIFETLRRADPDGPRLGVLCGSVVILPLAVCETMAAPFNEAGHRFSYSPLNASGYARMETDADLGMVVHVITMLLEAGHIQVLIGTKALLGEGWDSPCINTLILATFIGSFVSSNQMRGRAMRTYAPEPGKVSNIWHLAALPPAQKETLFGPAKFAGGSDFDTLRRRFSAFLGPAYDAPVIQSGLMRLGVREDGDFTAADIPTLNRQMLGRALNRGELREKWLSAFAVLPGDFAIEETTHIEKAQAAPTPAFRFAATYSAVSFGALALAIVPLVSFSMAAFPISTLLYLLCTACFGVWVRQSAKLVALLTPQRRIKKMVNALFSTLKDTKNLSSAARGAAIKQEKDGSLQIYLQGGSALDKSRFATCVAQFFGVIENPRYLLAAPQNRRSIWQYLAVPELLGRRKEDAERLRKSLKSSLGHYELLYTKNPTAKTELLQAQMHSRTYAEEKEIGQQKITKDADGIENR